MPAKARLASVCTIVLAVCTILLSLTLLMSCGGTAASSTASNRPPGGTPTPTPPGTPTPPTAPPQPTPPPPTPPPPPAGVSPTPISGTPAPPPSGAPALCAVSYQALDIPNAASSGIQSVNNGGTMVGGYADANGLGHGFIFQNGQVITVDGPNAANPQPGTPNGSGTALTAIADTGAAAGYVFQAFPPPVVGTYAQGFVYQDGKFTMFSNGSHTLPTGINSAGVVVGESNIVGCCTIWWIRNPDGSFSGFTESGKGEEPTPAADINNRGQIAGVNPLVFTPNFTPPPYPNPTSASNGTFAHFTVPGTTAPNAQGMNNNADVVGFYGMQGSTQTWGWRKTGDSYCTLNVPGSKRTSATDINDTGVIVGTYTDSSDKGHGFIAK